MENYRKVEVLQVTEETLIGLAQKAYQQCFQLEERIGWLMDGDVYAAVNDPAVDAKKIATYAVECYFNVPAFHRDVLAYVHAIRTVQDAIQERTGIRVLVGYHNSETSGREGDQLDGLFFHVPEAFRKVAVASGVGFRTARYSVFEMQFA